MEIEDDPIDICKCMARRLNRGRGGRIRLKLKGSKYCKYHQTEDKDGVD